MDLTAVLVAFFHMLKVPTILFMCVVAPIWIGAHYRNRKQENAKLSVDEQGALEALTRAAERMETRINTLERILDVEAPNWKERWKDRAS